ncbi:MAG: hypothetical protein CL912_04525 [Deltaproteobacteria bacterium]|nr:hypothetical protein [Deltaproteobacteria bacterium]
MSERKLGKQKECVRQPTIALSSRADDDTTTMIATLEADRKAASFKVEALERSVQDSEALLQVERQRISNAMALANSLVVLPGNSKRAGDPKEMSTRQEKRARRDDV